MWINALLALDGYGRWSPDGRKIVFYSGRDNRNYPDIFVINADGREVVNVSKGGKQVG